MNLLEQLVDNYAKGNPFVVYKKPDSDIAIGVFQNTTELHLVEDFSEKGFVLAPFFEGKRVYIPFRESTVLLEKISKEEKKLKPLSLDYGNSEAKAHFEALVKRCISAIDKGFFEKVVPSRKEVLDFEIKDIAEIFNRLVHIYPSAFCSVFFHPQIGLWMGATPERLLQVKDDTLYTMALAGTQINHGKEFVEWGSKEKEEQQFVTDFIVQSLQPFAKTVQISEPYTKRAAKVMHICTDIEVKLNALNLKPIVDALHPTPAVCGLPKNTSRNFLLKEEGYNRKYYAGYLGELNCNIGQKVEGESDLFVNLRCMEIEDKQVNIYVGCGVTKDSNPESEFVETVNKSSTMKQILID